MNKKEKLLLNESNLTFSLLGNGLNSLRKSNIYNKGLYYQAFFSLSIGLERLLKIALITKFRTENNENFPTGKEINLKKFGHDLIKLETYLNININNDIEKSILIFLNEFSKKSRYYNIDGIIDENLNYNNPLNEWYNISKNIVEKHQKNRVNSNREILANILDEKSDIHFYNLDESLINKTLPLLNELEDNELVQKYATEYVFNIIRSIVYEIYNFESGKNMMPVLKEVFSIYLGNYTPSEIRNKKNWLQLT